MNVFFMLFYFFVLTLRNFGGLRFRVFGVLGSSFSRHPRQGSQQSVEFDEFGECDEYGESGDISPNPKIQANELETRVPTKRIQQMWRIWRYGSSKLITSHLKL